MVCIICGIIAGELPASVVYEDDQTIAFLDIQPLNPGHVLIAPKRHAASFLDLEPEELGQMMQVGQLISKGLYQSQLRCEGVNLFLADGRAAGQEVDHVHLHVFPRYEGDGISLQTSPDNRKTPGKNQLLEDARLLTEAITRL